MANGSFAHRFVSMERKHRYAAALLVLAVIAVIFMASYLPCPNEACFIEQANMCGHATFMNKLGTATILYETKECTLNKTVIAMEEWEPPEVKDDFIGKSMLCLYIRGDFSPLFLETVSHGVDSQCRGELRDTILLYQYF
jgi:hypothetical protein